MGQTVYQGIRDREVESTVSAANQAVAEGETVLEQPARSAVMERCISTAEKCSPLCSQN